MLKTLEKYLNDFVYYAIHEKIEIYNEFSLQHELGIYLRERLKDTEYKIQFERNAAYFGVDKSKLIKREIDISVFNRNLDEKYAIELKYPLNGQYPETMYSFIKDICFCEQLTQSGFDGALAFAIVNDKLFYEGSMKEGIYSYFRTLKPLKGSIIKPTGTVPDEIILNREYFINWNKISETSRYYIIATDKEK